MKGLLAIAVFTLFLCPGSCKAQDTFSIVAVDSITGEVGSAGASCVDLVLLFPNYATDFLGELIPGTGAINTQASYNSTNQVNARTRMLAGDTPQQIINWLVANDAQGNSAIRQYGIAALVNGSPQTAGFTGASTINYKNHVAGPNYCIQGNILLNQSILDSMEARFINEPGDLACKLMAAMQGAKVVGADTRCTSNGTSSLFAFLKVAQPSDPPLIPSLLISVKTAGGSGIEPIDSLQTLFNAVKSCNVSGLNTTAEGQWNIYPNPANDMITIRRQGVAYNNERSHFRLFDTKGRLVQSGRISNTPYQIELGNVLPGMYILELETNQRFLYQKIIRN